MKKQALSLLLALMLCLVLAGPAAVCQAADLPSTAPETPETPETMGHTETLTVHGKPATITNVLRVEERDVQEYGTTGQWEHLYIYIVSDSGAVAAIGENALGAWSSEQVWIREDECFADPTRVNVFADSYTLEIPASCPGGEVLLYHLCGVGIMRESDFAALTPGTFMDAALVQ